MFNSMSLDNFTFTHTCKHHPHRIESTSVTSENSLCPFQFPSLGGNHFLICIFRVSFTLDLAYRNCAICILLCQIAVQYPASVQNILKNSSMLFELNMNFLPRGLKLTNMWSLLFFPSLTPTITLHVLFAFSWLPFLMTGLLFGSYPYFQLFRSHLLFHSKVHLLPVTPCLSLVLLMLFSFLKKSSFDHHHRHSFNTTDILNSFSKVIIPLLPPLPPYPYSHCSLVKNITHFEDIFALFFF